MQVVLMMFRGDNERRSFSITREVTVIGRREDCDFRIPLGEISRKHCRLMKDGDILRVEDLGSSNGTYKNGERLQSGELAPGDTLQVGSVTFVVQIDGLPEESEMRPVLAGERATEVDSNASDHAPTVSEPGDSVGRHATMQPQEAKKHAKAKAGSKSENAGEFDPMSVLDSDSEDVPTLDDSSLGEDLRLGLEDSAAPRDDADDNVHSDKA